MTLRIGFPSDGLPRPVILSSRKDPHNYLPSEAQVLTAISSLFTFIEPTAQGPIQVTGLLALEGAPGIVKECIACLNEQSHGSL